MAPMQVTTVPSKSSAVECGKFIPRVISDRGKFVSDTHIAVLDSQ